MVNKMKTPFLRTAYNYDTNAASNESGVACEEPSLAQQHYRDECDINNILRQFNVTGLLPESPLSPRYGDFTGIKDYQSALNAVIEAEDGFMALPADIRSRFMNDPTNLIDFLANDANRAEAEKLGLVDPKIVPTEQKTEVKPEVKGE
jgi:phage internal scaffolding protein